MCDPCGDPICVFFHDQLPAVSPCLPLAESALPSLSGVSPPSGGATPVTFHMLHCPFGQSICVFSTCYLPSGRMWLRSVLSPERHAFPVLSKSSSVWGIMEQQLNSLYAGLPPQLIGGLRALRRALDVAATVAFSKGSQLRRHVDVTLNVSD